MTPAVLAQQLRAAVEQLQDAIRPRGSLRVVSQPERFGEALDSIRAIADELADQARAPDTAGGS